MALNGAAIGGATVGTFADLRNGLLANISAPARRGAIDQKYHWVWVTNAEAGKAPYYYRAYCATVWARLAAVAFPPEAEDPGNLEDFAVPLNAAIANAALRASALWLAGSRVGAIATYGLTALDIVATEAVAASLFTATDNNAAAVPVGAPAALAAQYHAAAGTVALTSAHAEGAGNLTYVEALALSFPALAPAEEDLVFAAFRMGSTVVALNGLTLWTTGHHYLSSSAAAFTAVEKQVLVTDSLKAAWQLDPAVHRDHVWHKAAHPVRASVAQGIAIVPDIKEKFVALGIGSAGVRLPFVEDSVKAARAALAMLTSVQPAIASSDWKVDLPSIRNTLTVVDSIPHGMAAPDGLGVGVVDRVSAIRLLLVPALENSVAAIGWISGVYKGAADVAEVNLAKDSIWKAKSLTRIRSSAVGAEASGRQAYDNLRKRDKLVVEAGGLPPVHIAP